jgi:alkylated DNA repair dioxygenase AlkB
MAIDSKMESVSLKPNGYLRYWPSFLSTEQADTLFQLLCDGLEWEHYTIRLFGRQLAQPRLTAFYGEGGIEYEYSGLTLAAKAWTEELAFLRAMAMKASGVQFNSVLCNLYRNGGDSMGWHSDDERSLGKDPIIASVSLGATRRFDLRPKMATHGSKQTLSLDHGSLLVMGGDLQHHWQHQIAKTKRVQDARINLTFRQILL